MMRRWRLLLGAALFAMAGCQGPPPDVYVSGSSAQATAAVPVGNNAVGEACRYRLAASDQSELPSRRAAEVLCGRWEQPSGKIFEVAGGGDAAALQRLAAAGTWRAYLDERFACQPPTPTQVLGGAAALLMQCSRRSGGW